MCLDELPVGLQQQIQKEFSEGEKPVWVGQPVARGRFPMVFYIPAAVGVPVIAYQLFSMRRDFGDSQIVLIGGILLVVLCFGLMTSTFWQWRSLCNAAAGTVYVITNRRAIIFDRGFYGVASIAAVLVGIMRQSQKSCVVRSYPTDKLVDLQRIDTDDGFGDLLFAETLLSMQRVGHAGPSTQVVLRSGFYSISDVKEIEERLRLLGR